jgi:hypothetical protein
MGGAVAQLSFLDRFRPVGAPGPAGPAGVPTADDQGPAVELAPVFDALAADVQGCRRLVDEARREAEAALSLAHERGAAIIAQARLDVRAERASAAARVEQATSQRDALLLAQARKEADDLEEARMAQLPGSARKVIDHLLSQYLGSEQRGRRP